MSLSSADDKLFRIDFTFGHMTSWASSGLELRKPLWRDLQSIDVTSRWREDWQLATVVNSTLVATPQSDFPVLIFTDISGHC